MPHNRAVERGDERNHGIAVIAERVHKKRLGFRRKRARVNIPDTSAICRRFGSDFEIHLKFCFASCFNSATRKLSFV